RDLAGNELAVLRDEAPVKQVEVCLTHRIAARLTVQPNGQIAGGVMTRSNQQIAPRFERRLQFAGLTFLQPEVLDQEAVMKLFHLRVEDAGARIKDQRPFTGKVNLSLVMKANFTDRWGYGKCDFHRVVHGDFRIFLAHSAAGVTVERSQAAG